MRFIDDKIHEIPEPQPGSSRQPPEDEMSLLSDEVPRKSISTFNFRFSANVRNICWYFADVSLDGFTSSGLFQYCIINLVGTYWLCDLASGGVCSGAPNLICDYPQKKKN